MKAFVFACLALYLAAANAALHCNDVIADVPQEWIDIKDECTNQMKRQIQEEMKASMRYMELAAHFSRDTVNRPGFAKHFFDASSEEREHGIKLISYLLMRGVLTTNVGSLINMNELKPKETDAIPDNMNGVDALKRALVLEAIVTKSIKEVIVACENSTTPAGPNNDYHLVDYLTGVFLEEQYNGQRELAGMISQLGKMMKAHGGVLGEFLYDKKLLE